MGLLSGVRGIYSLDTLDTRLTTPSNAPYDSTVAARGGADGKRAVYNKPDKRAKPPKWKTPEFALYYLVFIVVVPYMFWIVYEVSRRRFSSYGVLPSPE